MRVCFADDEPLARERMRKMLALDEDIEICGEAQNGEDMIALIQAEDPELVFLDIEMPKLDGFDVVEALAQATFRRPCSFLRRPFRPWRPRPMTRARSIS